MHRSKGCLRYIVIHWKIPKQEFSLALKLLGLFFFFSLANFILSDICLQNSAKYPLKWFYKLSTDVNEHLFDRAN